MISFKFQPRSKKKFDKDKCRVCGQTSSYSQQDGMGIVKKCNKCGHQWRVWGN